MVKKLFALASVTALAGLVSAIGAAGCSSTETVQGVTPDAGAADAKVKTTTDAKPPVGDVEEDPPVEGCLNKDPIDSAAFPYTKAIKAVGACTTKESSDLSAFYKAKTDAKEAALISEWSAVVSKECAACVFSDGAGATWTPIITKEDKLDSVNRGGCIELLSGKESCGKAYQQVTECRVEACLKDCKTQEEFTTCLGDGQGIFTGPCKVGYDLMQTECGKSLGAYETGCKGTAWTFEGPIKVQCITGGAPGDGG